MAAVGAVLAAGAPSGCAELPEIGENTCGNSIVEDAEDCDSFAPSGQSCRAVGAPGQCRWDCTVTEDGSRPACPTGWGCGADGICRAPTGAFAQLGEPIGALAIDAHDFDADQRTDLVTFDGTDLQLRFYEPDGSLAKVHAFSATIFPRAPAFGDLSGDGRTDAIIHLGEIGLGVLTATTDRALAPVVQATIEVPLPNDGSRLIAVNALVDKPGDETLAVLDVGALGFGVVALNQDETGGDPTLLFALPKDLDPRDIAGEVPSGDFDEDPARPCPELVVGFRKDNRIGVYTPCADGSTYDTGVAPRVVTLPTGHHIAGALFVGDTNGDDRLDILVPVQTARGLALDVAFGVGDGSFHSDPTALPDPGPGDDRAAFVVALGGFGEESTVGAGPGGADPPVGFEDGGLLAAGDLDGDGRVDLVTPANLWLSSGADAMPAYEAQSLGASTAWTVAAIADFNGNGHPDVVGASNLVAGLDFLNGAGGGIFNPFDIPTQRPVHRLAVGDFDGDLLVDLAFAEIPAGDGQQGLSFSFGRAFGPPEDPVDAGTLRGVQQLITGDRLLKFLIGGGSPDAMSELAIVSVSEDGQSGSLTVVPGSSDRRLQSPYILFEDVDGAPSYPLVVGAGQFTASDTMADLFALAQDLDTFETKVWLISSEGEGKFGPATIAPLDPGAGLYATWVAVGDLDPPDPSGTQLDEVVAVAATYASETEQGTVAVFRPDGNGAFTIETHRVGPALGQSFPVGAVVRLADVDGDGLSDLIARGTAIVVVDGGDTPAELFLFWNNGGQLDFDNPVPLPTLENEAVGSFATLDVDGDPAQEILVTGFGSAWILDAAGGERSITITGPLPDVPAGITAVGGDFNGDGVDDVAIGAFENGATSVLFGIPVRP